MKKLFLISLVTGLSVHSVAQNTYDDCADALANPMTVGASSVCGETATPAGTETGECLTNWAGNGNSTMWASFTATNDSMVINYVETTSDGEMLNVYGPNPSCQPSCASKVYSAQQTGDPGHHILLTNLVPNAVYLIQIDATDPNSPNDFSDLVYCMGVHEPSTNAVPGGANLLDECGTAFTETTDGGYWQSGTSTGFNNLDGNGTTTCGGCTAGDDTPFIINNAAWNTFCSLTSGTWQITVNNITGCQLSAPNAGIQVSVFTGTETALVNEGNSSSPQAPGSSYTSPTITVDSAECAFLMIDGFAGDICNYDVTLTNITGGCVILPLEFISLDAVRTREATYLNWEVASESNNEAFIIERSYDGDEFIEIGLIKSKGDNASSVNYAFTDFDVELKDVYYKLSSIDKNGVISNLAIKKIKGNIHESAGEVFVYPNPSSTDVNLEFVQVTNEPALIEVYDMAGTRVMSFSPNTAAGLNKVELSTTELRQGNYVIRVIAGDHVVTNRFTKR